MSSEIMLEIVELEEGGLAIRNPNSNASEPMIKLEFSEEVKAHLDDQYIEVARFMLTAGMQIIADMGTDLAQIQADGAEGQVEGTEEAIVPTIH